MRFRLVPIVLLGVASTASGSNDVIINVAQPLIGYDMGVSIGFAAFAGYSVGPWEFLISGTCEENSTRILGSGRRGVATENRNAASIVGLTIQPIQNRTETSGSSFQPFFGDTLRVVLTVPEVAIELEKHRGWEQVLAASLRDVVCRTIECARINAASVTAGSRQPKLRYLSVEIEGWDGAADLARTYSLEGIPSIRERQTGRISGGSTTQSVCD